MAFDDLLAGREADAGALVFAGRVQALEEVEDAQEIILADADAVFLVAEAEGTKQLAAALQQMSDSSRLIVILDKLPILMESGGDAMAKVAEAIFKSVAMPLGQIDRLNIVDMGGNLEQFGKVEDLTLSDQGGWHIHGADGRVLTGVPFGDKPMPRLKKA